MTVTTMSVQAGKSSWPQFEVGAGIKRTTVRTEPAPEGIVRPGGLVPNTQPAATVPRYVEGKRGKRKGQSDAIRAASTT